MRPRSALALLTVAVLVILAGTPLVAQTLDDGVDLIGGLDGVGLSPLDGVPLIMSEQTLDGSVGLAVEEDVIEVTLGADVLFDFDSADLRPEAQAPLEEARTHLERAVGEVSIVGHTDAVGTDEYNDDLSLRRAEAVRAALDDALEAAGVTVTVEGRGSREPVAPNETEDGEDNPEGRQLNRRVTVRIPVADAG